AGEVAREPEVGELGLPARGLDEDVLRLHVAVDDPALVGVVEAVGDLGDDAHEVLARELPRIDRLLEVVALDEVHGGEARAAAAALLRVRGRDDDGRGAVLVGGGARRGDLAQGGLLALRRGGGESGDQVARPAARAAEVALARAGEDDERSLAVGALPAREL